MVNRGIGCPVYRGNVHWDGFCCNAIKSSSFKPGEEVSIFIGNIGAGDPFQIDIIGNIKIDAADCFSFKLNKLNLPLDIANPTH